MGRLRNALSALRATEATQQELIASGAAGSYGGDPIDGDKGFIQLGQSSRDQPRWTTEKQRAYSIAAYRSNPMARSIIDTFTSFCVGDRGVSCECDHPDVRAVVEEFWNDPRNQIGRLQPIIFRDWMMNGESIWEYLVGESTGVVRWSPISSRTVEGIELENGNPLWFDRLRLVGHDKTLQIVRVDDVTGLRVGQVGYFPSWRALLTDRRGTPFLAPILDDLDAYAQVLNNLVDRTALARYISMQVVVDGNQESIDKWVAQRGGYHIPRSGSIEVTNKKVEMKPLDVKSGSFEDTNTALSVLTNIASGAGLAKTWLAESEGANRATSMSMAEPVRRRIGGVQNEYLEIMAEHVRFAVDQAVAAGRLPRMLASTDADGIETMVKPSQMVRVNGPAIAATDAQIMSTVMLNLGTALVDMIGAGVMTEEAGAWAARKAWEQFVGGPMPSSLAVTPATIAAAALAKQQAPDPAQADPAAPAKESYGEQMVFNFPEQPAPVFNVRMPEVTMNLPEQPTPIVNVSSSPAAVNVPAPVVYLNPEINVEQPKVAVKSRRVVRDEAGQITGIVEE
jgi:hypothetical protein